MIALNQLERSGSDDPVIAEQISALKPLADRGAPTIEKLTIKIAMWTSLLTLPTAALPLLDFGLF